MMMTPEQHAELQAKAVQDLQAVEQRYRDLAATLRAQIKSGSMTGDEAVSWLCRNYDLTRVGAEDILDRY